MPFPDALALKAVIHVEPGWRCIVDGVEITRIGDFSESLMRNVRAYHLLNTNTSCPPVQRMTSIRSILRSVRKVIPKTKIHISIVIKGV
jgi:hypothetical protein